MRLPKKLNKKAQSNAKLVLFVVIYWVIFGIFFLNFSIAENTDFTNLNTSIDFNEALLTGENGTIESPTITNAVPIFVRFFGFQVDGIPFPLALIINLPPTLMLLFIILQLVRGSA